MTTKKPKRVKGWSLQHEDGDHMLHTSRRDAERIVSGKSKWRSFRVVELRKGEVIVDAQKLENLAFALGGILHADEIRAALKKVGVR